MRSSLFGFGGIFILCVNLWRYFHLMGSTILILWGHGQSKSLLLQSRHSHVMRKPTEKKKKGESSLSEQEETEEKRRAFPGEKARRAPLLRVRQTCSCSKCAAQAPGYTADRWLPPMEWRTCSKGILYSSCRGSAIL